jgi:GDP-L-fucose synthase
MNAIENKKVLVTGASGFLGKHVVERLKQGNPEWIITPSHSELDLLDTDSIYDMLGLYKPDIIIHLAAKCGGIGANQKSPGMFFYQNLKMGMELIEAAHFFNVGKFVQVGTVCSYPKYCPAPFKEDDIWNGYPEETNAPYGIAKKALLVQAQAYRQQYGFNAIYVVPVNLYGPGDNFDPSSSHVIPALIKKMMDAKDVGETNVSIWGTGRATREFLYVKDAAEGIVLAAEKYDGADPVNLGNGMEISIEYLVHAVAHATGYHGEITYDTTKPDGQPRRLLDTNRALKEFGFEAKTPFIQGLKETVEWYETTGRNKQLSSL